MKRISKKVQKAYEEYKSLKERRTNPDGYFDDGGRWWPSENEKQECCEGIRTPSRAYPYSLIVHCRSLRHVCAKRKVDYSKVKELQLADRKKEYKYKVTTPRGIKFFCSLTDAEDCAVGYGVQVERI